jgi:hypothetical protein
VDAALLNRTRGIPRLQESGLNARVALFALVLALFRHCCRQRCSDLPRRAVCRSPSAQGRRRGVGRGSRAAARGIGGGRDCRGGDVARRSGLLARTFAELRRVDVGFKTSNLLVLRITPDAARYRTGAQTNDYYRRVLNSLREVPAIQSVAAVTSLPMSAIGSDFTSRTGRSRPGPTATPSRKPAFGWRHPDTSGRWACL